jgi:hypothetical protein
VHLLVDDIGLEILIGLHHLFDQVLGDVQGVAVKLQMS